MLIGSGLLAGLASARAADLPLKAPPPPPPPIWTGFYVGGNIGAMRGNADYDTVCPTFNPATCPLLIPFFAFNSVVPRIGPVITFVPNPFTSLPGGGAHDASLMGGAQAGYNWQVNKWVFGVEGDVDATRIRASLTRNAADRPDPRPAFSAMSRRPPFSAATGWPRSAAGSASPRGARCSTARPASPLPIPA